MHEEISEFIGAFEFLSNSYPSTIYVDHVKYRTVTHAYQALKCASAKNAELVRNATTPQEAVKLARAVPVRSDWNDIKRDTMLRLLRLKFQNPFLRELLLNTGDAKITCSTFLCELLCQVRREIKESEDE